MTVLVQDPVITYTANGSVTDFSFPFRVIFSVDLKVYVDGVLQLNGYSITGLDDPSGGTVIFDTAPVNGAAIRLQRLVTLDRDIDYIQGGALISDTLDTDFDRIVHQIQDLDRISFKENSLGHIDAGNRRLTNVIDPIGPQDATTKFWVETANSSSVFQAANSATAALASQNAAANSASDSLTSANNSAASQLLALDWASNTTGIVDLTDYSSKAYAIGGVGVTGVAGKGSSKEWAITAEDVLVDTVDYSAKHYSAKSSASAGAASTSETNALTSENNAELWATEITGIVEATDYSSKAYAIGGTGVTDTLGKGAAKEWATKGENILVDTSEYSAKHYSIKSSISASNASTASDLAAISESNAATSASAASASETAAGLSETNSAASATESHNWAITPENVLVPEGNLIDEYSAFHWAKKAQVAATGNLTYQGSYDASTGVYPPTPELGDYYKISVAGTILGTVYDVGDSIIYNGTDWDKIDNTEQVTSVGGNVGAITDTQLLTSIKNVDGIGSGLDADLLDGFNTASASTANTVVLRDSAGDINARLFRSEYDVTNPTIGYIMTQVDTLTNNYMRPSTPAQLRTALNVENGATADQTASEILTLVKTVDGIGSGLDADLLDGQQPSTAASLNTIVQRNSSGYVYANYFNTTANVTTAAATHLMVETGSDSFIRKQTPAQFITNNNVATSDVTGGLKTTVIDIGVWNMDTASSITVPHGLTQSKIRSVKATIRSDTGNIYSFGDTLKTTETSDTSIFCLINDVALYRSNLGLFDHTAFSGIENRGWIIIEYVD